MKTKKLVIGLAGLIGVLFFFDSCKKNHSDGSITVRLTDAPGPYQQVNVDIQRVSVHMEPNSGKSSWIDLPTKAGIYDLIKLQNGIDTSLVKTTQLPAGKISQMRLILGSHNTVMADSVIYDLTVPSGSESGIKLKGDMVVDPNKALVVILDFDANESIHQTGNGKFMMKPTIKTL